MEAKRKPQPRDTMRLLNFKVAPEKIDRLREIALAEHRTVSQELRHMVDRRIAEAAQLEETA